MKRILEEFRLGFNVMARTGVMIYGYLGTVLLVSVFWFFSMTPVLLWVLAVINMGDLPMLVMSIPIFALGAVPMSAALYVVNRAFHKQSVSPLDFLVGIRKFFFRSYALGLLFFVVMVRPMVFPGCAEVTYLQHHWGSLGLRHHLRGVR
jgi:hypothetical protein